MNTFIENLRQILNRNRNNEIIIESGMPLPIKRVKYQDQLSVLRALGRMKPGDSFPVGQELTYAVRKMANDHHSEMKISVRKIGDSYRVFRVA